MVLLDQIDAGPLGKAVIAAVYLILLVAALYFWSRAMVAIVMGQYRELREERRRNPQREWIHSYMEAAGRASFGAMRWILAFWGSILAMLLFGILLVWLFDLPVSVGSHMSADRPN